MLLLLPFAAGGVTVGFFAVAAVVMAADVVVVVSFLVVAVLVVAVVFALVVFDVFVVFSLCLPTLISLIVRSYIAAVIGVFIDYVAVIVQVCQPSFLQDMGIQLFTEINWV